MGLYLFLHFSGFFIYIFYIYKNLFDIFLGRRSIHQILPTVLQYYFLIPVNFTNQHPTVARIKLNLLPFIKLIQVLYVFIIICIYIFIYFIFYLLFITYNHEVISKFSSFHSLQCSLKYLSFPEYVNKIQIVHFSEKFIILHKNIFSDSSSVCNQSNYYILIIFLFPKNKSIGCFLHYFIEVLQMILII
jgi:hypothetical protein